MPNFNAPVIRRSGLSHPERIVAGGIVDYEDLDVDVGLLKDALKAFL
jgi:hypothetical protein